MTLLQNPKKPAWFLLGELFERKTVKAFAWQVPSLSALVPALQEALQPYLLPEDPIRSILFAPAQSVLADRNAVPAWWPRGWLPWQITPEHTLVLTSSRLLAASAPRQAGGSNEVSLIGDRPAAASPINAVEPPRIRVIPFKDILSLQSATILLNSWFDVSWVQDGRLENLRVHFNTVSRPLFEALAASLRSAMLPGAAPGQPQASQQLEALADMPYKFRSLIPLRLLLPGEPVQAALFRPSIWRKRGGFFKDHLASKLALVRTYGFLIVAEEELTSEEDAHGLISRFYPLANLSHTRLEPDSTGISLVLSLSLHGVETEVRLPFPPAMQPDLLEFLK